MTNKVIGEYVSVTQGAQMVGMTRQGIHRMIERGAIPATMVGKQYVIPTKILKSMFKRCPHCGQIEKK